MDFYKILTKNTKEGNLEMYPDFVVDKTEDLMLRGGSFYAIWDQERGMWSTDPFDVRRIVDQELEAEAHRLGEKTKRAHYPKFMRSYDTGSWKKFIDYAKHMSDNAVSLDAGLTFTNTKVKKADYVSKCLPYALEPGDISAWDELVSTLYAPEERAKIEWAIGAVVSGDSKKIQKFLVFYGPAGTGKSTILNIISTLFHGYSTTFDGKALGSSNGTFATEAFKHGPLVALQHDGDLSKIEDNTRLNSIISHEEMRVNEKYKPEYTSRINAMLFMGSNQPVKISDAKSGIIRRLIDVHPTGVKLPNKKYHALVQQIGFELGPIADHCLGVYKGMGQNYYSAYRPLEMMLQTDVFFNFIEAYYDVFKSQDMITVAQAYKMYGEYCEETGIDRRMPQYKLREELRDYFDHFSDRKMIDGQQVRSVYTGFNANKFKVPKGDDGEFKLVLEETKSIFDGAMSNQKAQLANADGTPAKRWANATTNLESLDTKKLHYVKVPPNHVVIDFDLKEDSGTTALDRNLAAASLWPPTYAEISKSGNGVHLHYSYSGEISELAPIYSDGIEVKVFTGDSSLRRRLSKCNAVPIAVISNGLPLKQKKEKMLKSKTIKTEKGLRDLIGRNLRKEIHPGTKPSVDFIKKILDDAYEDGVQYDVSDLRTKIVAFANNSSNQAKQSLHTVKEMRWSSSDSEELPAEVVLSSDDRPVFFDVEVYPNLFVVCWKYQGDEKVIEMTNPQPHEVEELFKLKLVGFYNRRYDNHILYAAAMGASVPELFKLSGKIIEGNRGATFGAAYNISYADIWDFSSEKKSLKKWEVDLGILHMELDFPWDQSVDEKDWPRVVEYCKNDVRATETVFEHRRGDFIARQILAELSGLSVNDTTQNHTAKIIFENDKYPQKKFNYKNLGEEFDGYTFELGKSSYKGEDPGEGGYVYAEPGIYEKVALLDIVSMHPTTIEILNLFGPYTQKFSDLKNARVEIKKGEFDSARKMLDGRLAKFLSPEWEEADADTLAYALKIVVNSVYGLTSAKFDNKFKDHRNIDNIVAKRGALFMIDLKQFLQNNGYTVVHIKTDSIKIPNADQDIIRRVTHFGLSYGYHFVQEATYDKFCLVNDAVYVAGIKPLPWEEPFPDIEWKAVGAQFQHPYVFKSLFSGEDISFDDMCEARSVNKGAMYLDLEHLEEPDVTKMRHVGKTGQFVPVLEEGAKLYRVSDGKYYAVSGTKKQLWMEAHVARTKENLKIDTSYFEKLKDDAIQTIEKFGSFEEFIK
jgi:energy-coupling factor transporter ATP-binding protein EcfA2